MISEAEVCSGDGHGEDVFLSGVGDVGDFSPDAAFVHDEDAVAHAEDFG